MAAVPMGSNLQESAARQGPWSAWTLGTGRLPRNLASSLALVGLALGLPQV